MKKIMILAAGLMLGTVLCYAQDVPEAQVPSVVLNNFKKEFPRASDVEWELKNTQYEVEFELGLADHEVWYDATGQLVKHEEDFEARNLPESVNNTIKKSYAGYRISDVKKITTGSTVNYKMELKKDNIEWKIVFSAEGGEVSKVED